MATPTHTLKIYTKIGTLIVFSILCIMVQTALVVLLFIGGTFNDILPWTVTVITVYLGVIKMMIPSSSSNNSEPAYFTPTPSPNPYANQPHTPEHI